MTPLIPSPPESGERVRVRGYGRETGVEEIAKLANGCTTNNKSLFTA